MAFIKQMIIVGLLMLDLALQVLCGRHSFTPQQAAAPHHYNDAVGAASDARYRRHHDDRGRGVLGPVHTFVKTDKHANFKWGVRHHVGHKYS